MKTDIGIWRIDRESRSGNKLDLADRIETEEILEDFVVANPEMLMSGLILVGRQVPVGSGFVDLLGIDEDGRLVVFELKRQKLTRDAVAQILDYCTYLETLPNSELATLISERSGTNGIRKIVDFEEWYANQAGNAFRPVRMVLVGLGVDTSAHRMVAYLAESGVDIRLLTFHGYMHGNSMLLARQARTAEDPRKLPSRTRPSSTDLSRKASEYGVAEIWQDANSSLDYSLGKYYTKSGITFTQRTITLPEDVRVRVSHSVTIDESGKIRITFDPAAVDLCGERFEVLKKEIPFRAEKPPNAPQTRHAPNQWSCSLDQESWHKRKAHLIEFVRHLEGVWRDHEHLASDKRGGT